MFGDQNSAMYAKTMLLSFFPILVVMLIAGFWFLKFKVFKKSDVKTPFISSIVMFFLLMQPSEINLASRLIACKEFDDGRYFMVFELVQECYTDKHIKYILFLFLPMIGFWGIFFPVSLVIVLWRNKSGLDNLLIRHRYGYVYYGYKIKYYYWEFIIFVRKMTILFIVLFFQFNNTLKVLYILMILGISLALQIAKKPYYTEDINSLETVSITSSILTLFFALIYYLNDSSPFRTVLFLVVLIVNGIFFLFFFQKIYFINRHFFIKCLNIVCFRCFKSKIKGTQTPQLTNYDEFFIPDKGSKNSLFLSLSDMVSIKLQATNRTKTNMVKIDLQNSKKKF